MTKNVHYGWAIAVVLFLCFALMVGITQYSFGVFVTELQHDLGWSRTQINGSLSLFAATGLLAPGIGWVMDRVGSRWVMVVSTIFLGISQLLRPWMTEVWHFYALSLIQYAAVPGAILLPSGKLIGIWFERSRGRAMGLTAMGANFGGFVFSLLTGFLVPEIGWRAVYFVYGLSFLALVPLIFFVIQDAPHAVKAPAQLSMAPTTPVPVLPGMTASAALRTRAFVLIVIGLFFATLTYQSVLTQIVPHLEDIGISRGRAATALSFVALSGMFGKVLFGYLTEKIPARFAVGISLGFQIVGLAILVGIGSSSNWVWVFVPIFGLGFGALGALMPLIVQDTFGVRAYGSIFGLVNFFILGAALVGPPLVGMSYDASGTYVPAFITLAGLFALGGIVVAFARPPRGFGTQIG